ncbi:hypothetical protein IWX47DRAFT_136286 [Phyllosticta citricarpa]
MTNGILSRPSIHPTKCKRTLSFLLLPSLSTHPTRLRAKMLSSRAHTHTHTHTHTHNRAQEPKRVSRPSARSLARPPTLFIVPVPVPIPSAALFHSHSTATSALRCAAPTDLTCLPPIVAHRTLPIAHCPSPFWVKCLLRTCALAHTRCRIIIANLRKRWPRDSIIFSTYLPTYLPTYLHTYTPIHTHTTSSSSSRRTIQQQCRSQCKQPAPHQKPERIGS